MAVEYREEQRLFALHNDHSTYTMAVASNGTLVHLYYGKRLRHAGALHLMRSNECPAPDVLAREKLSFLSSVCAEYPAGGTGDMRESCLRVRSENGADACELFYESYRIEDGKPGIPGLPASFAGDEEGVETLVITLCDPVLNLAVDLYYSVFPKEDVIARSARIRNEGSAHLELLEALSACLDRDYEDEEVLTLSKSWARERHIQRTPLPFGRIRMSSVRGESSHQEHPFIALLTPGTDQRKGEVTAMSFVYSGNFIAQAERSQHDQVRLVMGIHPQDFAWGLEPGESFCTPEVLLTYSDEGLGRMTRSYHDFLREHMIRSPYRKIDPPVLINNWEATYFNFNTEKILAFAKTAAEAGIEMMVLDDGWFGARNSDNAGLGDWIVNEEKLPGGIRRLGEGIHALGMKFGLWFEPEMVNPDSDLYRAHPDWALQVPGRQGTLNRTQLVLDITRPEVRDGILDMVFRVIREGGVDYVKWDMNRYLSDVYSHALPANRQGEVYHRYCLAVYEMQERLLREFPELLLENCSGGGARFDAGMLYYSQQIWTSDDTDALERLRIQEGTALIYPLMSMGAHVSKCPNEQVGRQTPFSTRANVALAGTFGYELNIAELPEAERAQIPGQVQLYHRFHRLFAGGDYYRLHSWNDAAPYDAWLCAAKDRSEAVLVYVQALGRPNFPSEKLLLEGLDPDAEYEVSVVNGTQEREGRSFGPGAGTVVPGVFYGEELMQAGFLVPGLGDFESRLYSLKKKQ